MKLVFFTLVAISLAALDVDYDQLPCADQSGANEPLIGLVGHIVGDDCVEVLNEDCGTTDEFSDEYGVIYGAEKILVSVSIV